jgi:acetolactate synthase I/II/III large subunit
MTCHTASATRTAAHVLVEQLRIQGVQRVFCVPGESYLAVLDALKDSGIEIVVCRNEGGAAMMAEAHGKATGRPGICFVTRGPGATNASGGVHIAQQDSTPMILFAGQVESYNRGRGAFQELDFCAVFGSMTKFTAEIDDPDRMAEYVSRAFTQAMSGRPGPVVLALPHDMLSRISASPDGAAVEVAETAPGAQQLTDLQSLLAQSERPTLLLGGSRWDQPSCDAMMAFAKNFGIPAATGFRRAHLFDATHPNYAGDLGLGANPRLVARFKNSDLVIVAGGRPNELTQQGYTLFDLPEPRMKTVHLYPGAEEIGRVWRPTLGIHASPRAFAPALAALSASVPARDVSQARQEYLDWSERPLPQPGPVNLSEIMIWLRGHLPADAMLTNGAGNYAAWIHRFYRFRRFGTQVAPISGFMGYGLPAALAMKSLYRERPVIVLAGDGDFLMTGQEFATAVQYGLPVIVIVYDNGCYGTIRMHQEREYPGRVSGTDLRNPDFAAMARSFGAFGVTVEKTQDFAPAFLAAEASGQPAIIHVKSNAEGITPVTTLSAIREKALSGPGPL